MAFFVPYMAFDVRSFRVMLGPAAAFSTKAPIACHDKSQEKRNQKTMFYVVFYGIVLVSWMSVKNPDVQRCSARKLMQKAKRFVKARASGTGFVAILFLLRDVQIIFFVRICVECTGHSTAEVTS